MALIFMAIAAIKIIVILISPGKWNNVIKTTWANSGLIMGISLILAAASLYYLIQGGITIIQIFAVLLFLTFLMASGIAIYKKEVIKLADKLMKDKKIIKKSWLYILIWIALIIWGAKTLFMY
jgi:hypothetical protein